MNYFAYVTKSKTTLTKKILENKNKHQFTGTPPPFMSPCKAFNFVFLLWVENHPHLDIKLERKELKQLVWDPFTPFTNSVLLGESKDDRWPSLISLSAWQLDLLVNDEMIFARTKVLNYRMFLTDVSGYALFIEIKSIIYGFIIYGSCKMAGTLKGHPWLIHQESGPSPWTYIHYQK